MYFRKNLTAMWGQCGARPGASRFRVSASNTEDGEENAGSRELMGWKASSTASSFSSQNQPSTILCKVSSGEVLKKSDLLTANIQKKKQCSE